MTHATPPGVAIIAGNDPSGGAGIAILYRAGQDLSHATARVIVREPK